MRILITTGIYPPEVGGPATYTKLMEERLLTLGWAIDVLPFRVVRHLPNVIRHIAFLWHVVRMGKGVDVIYAQDVASVGLPALIGARMLGKCFAVRVPGDYAWEQSTQRFGVTDSIDDFQNKHYGFFVELLRAIQCIVVRHADLVITPSNYFTHLVSQWVPSWHTNVHTVYNGIEFPSNLPSKEEARSDFHIATSDKVILSAGRLVPWKGFRELIDVAVLLHSQDSAWRLIILGDGPERRILEETITANNAGDFVSLVGEQSREQMFAYCRSADVFVLNSSFESFSFQTVEVMSTGTPFVGTSIGSLPELIESEREGILVQLGNQDQLVRAITRIIGDEAFRRIVVEQALQKSRQFSIDRTVRETAQHIQKLFEKN